MQHPNPSMRQHLQEVFHREKLNCQELSPMELYICRLLAWGMTKKEIAKQLCLSFHTINAHPRNIYEKLNVHKETDLTRWYIFKEYGIADNPFKKVITVVMLFLCIVALVEHNNPVRVLRARSAPTARTVRFSKPLRSRRSKNDYQYKTA
jgi:DNA-binding CsgD family transcriptional regulator